MKLILIALLFSTGFAFAADVQTDAIANLIQPAAFTCSCHALDPSNPYNELICNNLQVGTTCGRVGNLICIPRCGENQ